MDKNLHNIDRIFSEAHKEFIEDAPADGWEKLQANLDKNDTEKYKRKFIAWKRVAMLLILLFSSFIIYETGIFKISNRDERNIADTKPLVINTLSETSPGVPLNNENNTVSEHKKIKNGLAASEKPTQPDQLEDNVISSFDLVKNSKNYSLKESTTVKGRKNKYYKQKSNRLIKAGTAEPDDETGNENSSTAKEINGIKISNTEKAELNKGVALAILETNHPIPAAKIALPGKDLTMISTSGKIGELVKTFTTLNSTTNFYKTGNKKFKPFWTAMPFVSNDWNMYQLDNDVPDATANIQDDEKVEVSSREKHESSFSAGIVITRQLSKHIGIQTGIVYANTSIAISPQNIYAEQQNGQLAYKYITSSGYGFIKPGFGLPPAVGDSIKSAEAEHTLQVFSIPLSISYRFDKNKFSFIPSAGLSANFITKSRIKTEIYNAQNSENVDITGLEGTRKFYTGFIADVNVQYNINSKLAVNLLPDFKYALSPITKNNVVKTFPYSFGLGAGITFKF
jgi:hypothetical protein